MSTYTFARDTSVVDETSHTDYGHMHTHVHPGHFHPEHFHPEHFHGSFGPHSLFRPEIKPIHTKRCRNGPDCPSRMNGCRFWHRGDTKPLPEPCWYWDKCPNGNKCGYLHHYDIAPVMSDGSLEEPDPEDLDECLEWFMRQDPVLSKMFDDSPVEDSDDLENYGEQLKAFERYCANHKDK